VLMVLHCTRSPQSCTEDSEHTYGTLGGLSTLKCPCNVDIPRAQRSDDKPVKPTRSPTTSDLPKKVISLERSLVILPLPIRTSIVDAK
jgi:hypothetical protein